MFELPKFWLSASVSPLFQCQTLRDFLKIHHGNSGKCVFRGSKNEKFSGGVCPQTPLKGSRLSVRDRGAAANNSQTGWAPSLLEAFLRPCVYTFGVVC